jgi:hypothetical protein
MRTSYQFCEVGRYVFDLGLCSVHKGFAQVDTSNDCTFFGTWVNPQRLVIFSYAEGDCILTECETVTEFVTEIHRLKQVWGKEFYGVDAGFNEDLKQQLIDIGLGNLLH